ncbi:hypothetical protein [Streptomyces sp. NPDC048473]|uniref:hypothetical protein n=1 Tax=unclassified Streptomyces TaxID=2593676 RepID=UPI003724987D
MLIGAPRDELLQGAHRVLADLPQVGAERQHGADAHEAQRHGDRRGAADLHLGEELQVALDRRGWDLDLAVPGRRRRHGREHERQVEALDRDGRDRSSLELHERRGCRTGDRAVQIEQLQTRQVRERAEDALEFQRGGGERQAHGDRRPVVRGSPLDRAVIAGRVRSAGRSRDARTAVNLAVGYGDRFRG